MAVGKAGLTQGWGSSSSLATLLAVGPARRLLKGRTRGLASLHCSLRTHETEPETQGVVPPVLRVRPGQGPALSHRDRDVEVHSLGSSSRVSPSGPTGYKGGPAKLLLTGRTGVTIIPSLLFQTRETELKTQGAPCASRSKSETGSGPS